MFRKKKIATDKKKLTIGANVSEKSNSFGSNAYVSIIHARQFRLLSITMLRK